MTYLLVHAHQYNSRTITGVTSYSLIGFEAWIPMVGEVIGLREESLTVVMLNEHGIKLNAYVYMHKFTCINTCS